MKTISKKRKQKEEALKELARTTALEILCFDRGDTARATERIFKLLKELSPSF